LLYLKNGEEGYAVVWFENLKLKFCIFDIVTQLDAFYGTYFKDRQRK